MKRNLIKYIQTWFPVLLFFTGLIFFSFFYRYHLHFIEKLQIFQYNAVYLSKYLNEPGFLSAFTGDFFIQFYYIPYLGGLIICFSLFTIYFLFKKILNRFFISDYWFIFPLMPVILLFLLHCSINYRFPATVSIILALWGGYLLITLRKYRIGINILSIFLSYFLIGFSAILLVFILVVNEFSKKKSINSFYLSAIYILTFFLGIFIARYFIYIISWEEIFIPLSYFDRRYDVPDLYFIAMVSFPFIFLISIMLRETNWYKKFSGTIRYSVGQILFIGIMFYIMIPQNISFQVEKNCRIDYEVRKRNWDGIIQIADNIDSLPPLNLPYLNLALSHSNELLTRMFEYAPNSLNALVPPKSEQMVLNTMAMEIYYYLGWTSLAQVTGIMANQETYRGQNIHCIQRLAEIEIVNGNHLLASKYLEIMDKTLFYKNWSAELKKYIKDDNLIKNNDEYREIRKRIPKKDLLSGANIIIDLKQYLAVNPNSKVAFDYLVAAYMLNKDNASIIDLILNQKEIKFADYPTLIQQVGMLYYIYKKGDEKILKDLKISSEVFNQFKNFYTILDLNKNNPVSAQEELKNDFGKTYWYYLYFTK